MHVHWNFTLLIVVFMNFHLGCFGGNSPFLQKGVHFSEAIGGWVGGINEYLTETFETVYDVSVSRCMQHCQERQACDFAKYHFIGHVCFFMRKTNQSTAVGMSFMNGVAYGIKLDWNMENFLNCQQCSDRETCYEDGSRTTCAVTNCDTPDVPNNTVVMGNVYNIGSRVVYKCSDDFKAVSKSIYYATCTPEGIWTPINITCSQCAAANVMETTAVTADSISSLNFICPSYDNQFRTQELSDGTSIMYSVGFGSSVFFEEAANLCNALNSELIKVTTSAKMEFVQTLTQCNGFDNTDFWINARKVNNVWVTSDDELIPMTLEFWSEIPIDATYGFCIVLRANRQFKFLDRYCDDEEASFICEYGG